MLESAMPRKRSQKLIHPLHAMYLLIDLVVVKARSLESMYDTWAKECPFIPGKVGYCFYAVLQFSNVKSYINDFNLLTVFVFGSYTWVNIYNQVIHV
jgi:hypothetical protein